MIDIVVRLVAAFLAHPTHGVIAMAQSLPRSAFNGAPAPAQPTAIPIFNDADHDVGSLVSIPAPKCLIVVGDQPTSGDVDDTKKPSELGILIGYATESGADAWQEKRTCDALMRGAKRTLRRYRRQAISTDTSRELDGVRVVSVGRVAQNRIPMAGEGESPILWGFLAVTLSALDAIE